MKRKTRGLVSALAIAVAASLVLSINGQAIPDAAADPVRPTGPPTQEMESTPGSTERPVGNQLPRPALADGPVRAPRWPGAAKATIAAASLSRGVVQKVGVSPVSVGLAPASRAAEARPLTVRILPQEESQRLGVAGLVFAMTAPRPTGGGADSLKTKVRVDYSAFAHAYGGDWGSRLQLVSLSCSVKGCSPAGIARDANNNVKAGQIEGELDLQQADSSAVSQESLFAVTAEASGPNGTYKATSLVPSATWQVSPQTGEFNWSYPLRVPPISAGPTPELSIGYSSGSVDGQVASTNNQTSWLGQGHQLEPGFIERKFVSCIDDMDGGNNSEKTGDLCWKTGANGKLVEGLVLSLGGRSSEIIKVSVPAGQPEKWKLRDDDGSSLTRVPTSENGVLDGEHWVLTTSEGTKYFFGLNPVAYAPARTNSVLTVPVFGNHDGEPCHAPTFAASFCQQQYRWNVDQVVDLSGNIMTYRYILENNYYGRNNNDAVSQYQRASYLSSIEYGERRGEETEGVPPVWVSFNTYERCTTSETVCTGPLNASTASHWPDVPADQICSSATTCPDNKSPSFFTRKRLISLTTNVWQGAIRAVDTWSFSHTFPATGDGTARSLWLSTITHKGNVGEPPVSNPPVIFRGVEMDNRVDNIRDGAAEMKKYRVNSIQSETGSLITVNYLPAHCTPTSKPIHPSSNGMRCMPVIWVKPLTNVKSLDYFHKYPVSQVNETDDVTDAPIKRTTYEYVGAAAWRFDRNDLAEMSDRTWGDWRGYQTVNVKVGLPGAQTHTRYTYFRGMHADRTMDGGAKTVVVADSTATEHLDLERLNGFVREEIKYNGAGGEEVTGTISTPWISASTGSDGKSSATLLGTKKTVTRTRLGENLYRTTETNTEFDNMGLPVEIDDRGDVANPTDNRCKRIVYARNDALAIFSPVRREEVVSVGCEITPDRANDLVSDVRTYYDGQSDLNAEPTRGLVTKIDAASEWVGGAPVMKQRSRVTHDELGRVKDTYDGLNRLISGVDYTPASGSLVTATVTTNAAGHTTSQTLDPAWGQARTSIDANGRRTDMSYDPLGRLTAVWLPDRSRSSGHNASMAFGYKLSQSSPNVVTTKTLLPSGGYKTSKTLFDGFLRERQTQTTSATGVGRILADTRYNNRGEKYAQSRPYYDSSVNGATDSVFYVNEADIPAETVFAYDGASRPTAEAFQLRNVEKWRTSTYYGGSFIAVTPPGGGTPTATIFDARDRKVELRQYNGPVLSDSFNATKYSYTNGSELQTITDARGSVWRYEYDLLGRKTKTTDPDTGISETIYDDADRVVSTRDARGVVLHTSYDGLNRAIAVRETSSTGPLRATWIYDTLAKGHLTSSTRHANGAAYKTAVTGYDTMYRPKGSSVVIPAVEGKLAGSYAESMSYLTDGSINTHQLPVAPGLPAETLEHRYNASGMPYQLGGYGAYVAGTTYMADGRPVQYDVGPTVGRAAWQTFTYETGTDRLATWKVNRENLGGEELFAYTYDNAGNVRSLTQTGYGAVDRQCFTTDFLRRVAEAWTSADETCATPDITKLGGPAPYWHSYRYSAAGDRTSQVEHRTTGGNITRTYTYPVASDPRPHGVTRVTSAVGTATPTVNTYGYDVAGNLASRSENGAADTFAWDKEGHLEKVAGSVGETTFVYTADGDRLVRRDPKGATLYVGSTEIRWDKASNSVSSTRFYQFGGKTLAQRTSATEADLVFADHHGTGQINVEAYTGAYSRRRVDLFGNVRQVGGPWGLSTRGFVNGVLDEATRLTHLGAREYDSKLGRFISPDPLIDVDEPQAMNAYAYGNNNPNTFSDPSGLMWNNDPEFESNSHGGTSDPTHPNFGKKAASRPPRLRYIVAKSIGLSWNANDSEIARKSSQLGVRHELIVVNEIIRANFQRPPGWVITAGKVAGEVTPFNDAYNCVNNFGFKTCGLGVFYLNPAAKGVKWGAKYGDDVLKWADDAVDGGKQAGKKCSFSGETEVLMADGTTKPLSQIKMGDQVKATDPETGESGGRAVLEVFVHEDTVFDLRIESGTLVTTEDHPFWNATDGAFQRADQLDPGDNLLSSDGNNVRVRAAITSAPRDTTAYNLNVDDIHTYYVLAGQTPVLVHNSNCPEGRLSDPLPPGMSKSIVNAYDDIRAGNGVPQTNPLTGRQNVFQGRAVHEKRWAGALEFRVPGSKGDQTRILMKTLPDGRTVMGWTNDHYRTIKPFTAPHFPDAGW
ncbi:polymorphic toxin-type HINT domain-containing protein [Kribbella deserti]|uniref:Polymorphic toxin-type HINT domain-containing protein n=1 Tax=Kribbella deserti TaxID=1926257 RepID=A0ABV6QG76_9ACTN